MAEELERLWSKLTFTEEEDEGIELDSSCTKKAREIGKNCEIMKILAHKSISIDTLRKNMRMLWKPNKGVQISEVDADLFLVEFGDAQDKKKVLDMSPWSYEKQLVLLQEFDGKLTPKELEIRWTPFWIQIFNLPLNCRTKEIGRVIGAKLGKVIEVDVPDFGVHWGTCLRVKVRIDANKRLVKGKKITVEGGECRWVNFKYKRLPNFCYQCGLLNHTLKDCPENGEENNRTEREELQYGAWLRCDIIRRSSQDQNRAGVGRGANTDTSRWNDGAEAERMKFGGAHVSRQPTMEENPLTQQKVKVGETVKLSEALHENGRVNELAEKQEEKKLAIEGKASNQTKELTKETESMLWVKNSDKGDISRQGLNLSYIEGLPEMAMTPDFEETLRKIDEDLGFNPAVEDAAPISVNKINSFEKPLARDHKSTSKVTHVAKPKGKD